MLKRAYSSREMNAPSQFYVTAGLRQNLMEQLVITEVRRVSFIGYTGGEGGSLRLWNLQSLHALPP